MGIVLALISVLLTSAAQLALGHAMATLPPVVEGSAFVRALWPMAPASVELLAGLAGYLASMYIWYLALHRLALSKACALLSLSYILVWLGALLLPGFQGTFSLQALAGVIIITAGVLLIFAPTRK